jgi:hypothetical protein
MHVYNSRDDYVEFLAGMEPETQRRMDHWNRRHPLHLLEYCRISSTLSRLFQLAKFHLENKVLESVIANTVRPSNDMEFHKSVAHQQGIHLEPVHIGGNRFSTRTIHRPSRDPKLLLNNNKYIHPKSIIKNV